ncbi:MAG: hypothetical protein QNK23_00900 [Crocinitomicaceae bacterium]|nr:hypothetical protein [Crocinitomicaceae bacterium]
MEEKEAEAQLAQIKELMKQSVEGREAIIEIEELENEGAPKEMIIEALKLIMKEVIIEVN